jgi:polyferredoxin
VHVLRILAQLLGLALFLALLVLTARGAYAAAHPWLAQLFLITDPLLMVGSLLAGVFADALLAGLVILALSLLAPRAYCGWICPLGTTMDIVDKLLFRRWDRSKNLAPRLRPMKYGLLAVLLVLAVFGLGVYGWFDPLCIATRSYATVILPIVDRAAKAGLIAAENAGAAGGVYDWASRNHLLILESDLKAGGYGVGYHWAWVFAALLAAIVMAQAYQKRFWCRNLCPLGALLGLIGSLSPLRPRVSEKCIACGKCR